MIQFGAQLLAVAMVLAAPAQPPQQHYPFAVGERAEYQIKLGPLSPGTAAMELTGIDTVRGRSAYHFSFTISAAEWPYHIRDTLQSWADTAQLTSLRFHQDQHEGFGDGVRRKRYEIFPERQAYQEPEKSEQPSVANPLDDASFLYFVRTQKLEVNGEYQYPRYFKPESNPVILKVLRRDIIKVPLGEFKTIVVQPIIKTGGLFSEGGHAEVWITDDSARMIVQIKTKLAGISTLTLQLKSYRPYSAAPPPRKP